MNADERRFEVLRAIVSDYVATREPVGSKTLVERHHLGVSARPSATTWPCSRTRATSPSRTPPPGGSPPTRATGCSSTGCRRSSRCRRRAPGDPGVPVRGRRPRRRAAPLRAAARPADPAGRRRAVPDAGPLRGAARRGGGPRPARLLLVVITDTGRVEQRMVELGDDVTDDASPPALAAHRQRRRPPAGGRGRRGHRPGRDRPARPAHVVVPLVERAARRARRAPRGAAACCPAPRTSPAPGPTQPATLRGVLEALDEQVTLLKLLAALDARTP